MWLKSLSVTEHVFFWIAIAGSAALVIQIIVMLCSFAGMDADVSDTFDGDVDSDGGLSFFSVKAITAFFALGGWCGFATASSINNVWAPVLVAIATGSAALVGVGFAMRGISKLQCSGNLVKEKLTGMTATVYVTVPAARSGRGKITLTAQGKFTELDAVTDDEDKLSVDTPVRILSYEEDFVVVAKIGAERAEESKTEDSVS